MLFDGVRREADPSCVPSELRPLERRAEGAASTTRDFALAMQSTGWVINDRAFDPGRVDAAPRLGSTEIWRFQNRSMMPHPMRVHLNMFQDPRPRRRSAGGRESGWEDARRGGSG